MEAILSYFSDRQHGPSPRTREDLPSNVWGGIITEIGSRVGDGSFGATYPDRCVDNPSSIYGTDEDAFARALVAEIPDLAWPLRADTQPELATVFDLIEFCSRAVAFPKIIDWHRYYNHPHLEINFDQGRAAFSEIINRVFARNGIAYLLTGAGQVQRIGPPIVSDALARATFRTGDNYLDKLLEESRRRYFDSDFAVRKDALEKLWDAWERLKTLEPGKDKQASIKALLDRVAVEPEFRGLVEKDALELTSIGNKFMIRHSEITKVPITNNAQVDYLFHQLFNLIWLALRSTNRT